MGVGIIVASITGGFGVITRFVNVLDLAVGKLAWITGIAVVLIILILFFEKKFFDEADKESRKEKLKRAEDSTLARGKIDAQALKDSKDT